MCVCVCKEFVEDKKEEEEEEEELGISRCVVYIVVVVQ